MDRSNPICCAPFYAEHLPLDRDDRTRILQEGEWQ